jgi:hypothetical protein
MLKTKGRLYEACLRLVDGLPPFRPRVDPGTLWMDRQMELSEINRI